MKSLGFEAQSTLSYALESGILDLDRVHELCMASKREQAKVLHPYSITPPAKDGERWRTNYTDRNGKRKTIRAQTEEALLDKLISLYLDRENLEKKTFQELFEEWIAYKAQITTSPNTILRHRQHFKKYIASSKLYQIRILKITEILLETECNRIVKGFNLSNKEWVNLKTILNGMFEYAERFDLQVKSSYKLRKTYASMCNANGVPIDFIREQLGHASLSTTYGYIYNPLTEAESYKMLTDVLSRKKDTTPEQETDSIVSAPKPDSAVATTVNIADNVVSLEAFQSRNLTVPKMSSNVPTFSKAIK